MALSNSDGRIAFPNANINILPRVNSDHHPLLASLEPERVDKGEKPFRYEAMWKTHSDFTRAVKELWNKDVDVPRALSIMTEGLRKWNIEDFGHVFKKKRRLLNRLNGFLKSPTYGRNPFLVELEKNLQEELNVILDQEKIFWLQKSRQQWIVEGDRNTKYYHTKTIIRRRRNRILKLRKEDGSWCENVEELKLIALNFFKKFYQDEMIRRPILVTENTFPRSEEEQYEDLC
ncbi:uncharacterized protein [Arachis hypogaea]|uniref:uncharacterized protein n=1 Tax=Arachis hypogaea TaxID=3818 RepID=UPI003B2192D4